MLKKASIGWLVKKARKYRQLDVTGMNEGLCEHCGRIFPYELYHSGFGDRAYAYCNTCGMTALFDGWNNRIPQNSGFKVHGPIAASVEPHVAPCSCGGSFVHNGAPRCPCCTSPLSAKIATKYIEANAPGTKKGWRWQGDWSGVYCINISDRLVKDPWKP